jgi:hypothetical protein
MTTKAAILECVQGTQDFLKEEPEIGMERNRKFQPRKDSNHNNTNEQEESDDEEST